MFEKVAQADFVCGEHEMLRLWAEKRVFEKLRRQNSGKPKWCFLDGPITANNPMGVHHAWGRAYKDAYQRFFAMTGHELRYQNGFDCQGLWVEVEVERALGYTTRNAIVEHGIDTFVNECKKRVLRFAARQTEQSIRLGYWMDWDDPDQLRKLADALGTGEPLTITSPSGTDETATADDLVARLGNPQWGGSYFTFSTENNETIWAFLKKCHQRGKIYQGYDVMPWSGRGGSAYSQMEVADGRRLTVHKSCFVRFPIVDKGRGSEEADVNNSSSQSAIRNPQSAIENEYLLVWTTTPWTLTSNVAAAVNSDLDYVKLKTKRDGAIYYFAKENLDYQRLGREFKEGFGRPEWSWPKDVPKLKTIAQIFKEQGGYEVEETTKGAEMVGWTYSGPFDDMRAQWSDFEPKIRDLKAAFGLDQSKIAFSISGSNFAAVVASARDAIGTFALDVQTALDAIRPPLETLADRILVIKDLCPPSAASTLIQYVEAINLIQTFDPSSSSVTDSDSILSLRELLPAINANPQVSANFLAVALNRKLVEAYENVIEWLKKPKSGVSCHRVIDGGRDSKGQPNVVAGEGTGIVHIAPGCGDIDHKIGDEHHFVTIAPLEEDGRFCADFFDTTGPVFTGLEAIDPDTAELVFKKLHEMHLLVASEAYPHVYPHCWRTGDELVFRLVDEWFINMDWRDEIKDVTQKITWLPNEIQGQEREVEWLTNMRDWMISKKRFWGLALPIWVDEETGDFEVMGSLSELKERAVEGWEQFEGHTPHRPWIDHVKIRNPKTGHLMSRILDVGNPWLDAGIVPFSTLHYNTSRDQWRQWYPADFVTECFPGQFRNWFYSLLALSTMMRYDETEDPMEKRPFKTLLGHRLVMNEQGEPMHKSDGTAIWFEEAAEQLGVDTMRWMYLAHNPTSDLRFGTRHPDQPVSIETPNGSADQTAEGEPICLVSSKPSDEIRRQILIPLWNSYKFFVNYAILDKFDPASEPVPINKRPEIDRWILSNLQALIRQCRKGFEAFDVASACRAAAAFIDDLSNWYIRRNRRRFWSKQQEVEQAGDAAVRDKLAAYQTLYEVLVALTKLLAPAIPFLTERMYQNLVVSCQLSDASGKGAADDGQGAKGNVPESVHLCEYPEADDNVFDAGLNRSVENCRWLVRIGHQLREQSFRRVRQPLEELRFETLDEVLKHDIMRYEAVISDELNVKQINPVESLDDVACYVCLPNLNTLGPKYGKLLGQIRQGLSQVDAKQLSASLSLEGRAKIRLDDGTEIVLLPEDVSFVQNPPEGWVFWEENLFKVALNTELTPELKSEGMARDFVRQVQNLRKQADLEIENRIRIFYVTTSGHIDEETPIRRIIDEWGEYICSETLANSLEAQVYHTDLTARGYVGDVELVIWIEEQS